MSYYPIFLNISDKKCVVCGGGEVALRKVRALLGHNARVVVVSPELCRELSSLEEEGSVEAIRRSYRSGDLGGAYLAIAATDDNTTNLKIAEDARRTGCLVNVVDDPGNSDFIVPSYLRRGDIAIAISTSGKSPALARKLRTTFEEEIGEEYALLLGLVQEVRAEVKRNAVGIDADAWQKALDLEPLISLLQNGRLQEAREMIIGKLMQQVE